MTKRRKFIKNVAGGLAGYSLIATYPQLLSGCTPKGGNEPTTSEQIATPEVAVKEMFFKISLAQWSLHKTLFAKEMDNLDFAAKARNDFDIGGLEYVNQFFKDKAKDQSYLQEMKTRAEDHNTESVLIMIDGEGSLGSTDDKERQTAIENHYKWVEAAKFLGCHSIRVNTAGNGTAEEVATAATDALRRLTEFAQDFDIGVIVENHGGYSSDGQWLSGVIKQVNMAGCGTLPDFGNFCIERTEPESNTPEGWAKVKCLKEYDRYQGVTELMPFAKGVSAKTNEFNAEGNDTKSDYVKLMKTVKDAGYTGFVGIEYEGNTLSEDEGIIATKKLLEKVGMELS